jgi:adenylate cyclase
MAGMELTPRLRLMNWLVSQGLTGLPENDLIRGFCERCCAEGVPVSRGMVFIDTLHPIFEGRGRWNDAETNEATRSNMESTNEGEAAQAWRVRFLSHAENGHGAPIDLARHVVYVHSWRTRRKSTSGRLCAPVRRGRHHGARWIASIPIG